MRETEYNLLDEPWVKVITSLLEQKEISLKEAMLHAGEYVNLSGEMATQDAAVLRILLAVAETIFYRYDADGNENELSKANDTDVEDVYERWEEYWNMGNFPERAVESYLESVRERFWLFHPKTPFFQVNDLQYGTDYDVKCLFGNVKESMNKATQPHFSMTGGDEVFNMSYGEAARWLIHLNAYAINIKSDKKAPGTVSPVGIGRLGRLGLVMVNGQNLFQILMLNLCALNDNGGLWESPKPIWEQEVRMDQGHEIGIPDNLPERYTVQSRRIMLKRDENGKITGFRALGGDFFPVENDSGEPMTIWKKIEVDKKTGETGPLMPQKHSPAVHAWREFPTLLGRAEGTDKSRVPGVVHWVNGLRRYNKDIMASIPRITFRMIGMEYGGGTIKSAYKDCVDDSLTMSAGLLDDLGGVWVKHISDQIDKCQSVASEAIKLFSGKMCVLLYGNGSAKNGIKDALIGNYYFSIDAAFREWLASIDPAQEEKEEKIAEWEKISYYSARKTVEDYAASLGPNFFLCREENPGKGKKQLLTVPKIVDEYLSSLNRIYKRAK